MVNGIDVFREHFAGLEAQYILIGGTACDLLYGQQGLEFRATKDFDIVLCVEALNPTAGFMEKFWQFVAAGGYKAQQQGEHRRLYRFIEPANKSFPKMLELFSRAPESIVVPEGSHLTPIPGDEELSSLSAILLNDSSYQFLVQGTVTIGGVRLATAERLIALKAHAWDDLSARKQEGDSFAIKKHRKDIYSLSQLLAPATRIKLPDDLAGPLRKWLEEGQSNPLDPKSPSLGGVSADEIHALIQTVFFSDATA